MPKFLELSANVNLSSSSVVSIEQKNMKKKILPYIENGEEKGYIITSPATGRNILIGKENQFNGSFDMPTFAQSIYVPEDAEAGSPEEKFVILCGFVGYLVGNEIVECMPMVDCTWEPEKEVECL